MKKLLLLTALAAIASAAFTQSYTVETVPNTKLVNNSYVSNPDNIISAETVSQIDAVLKSLEDSATAQVAVVLLKSIGDQDVFEFSESLFNHWGIGKAGINNGLLILFVDDQRTVRFHTGEGTEAVLPDAKCKRIQQERMVPYFKEGNYDEGMLQGVLAVAELLNDPELFADTDSDSSMDADVALSDVSFWLMIIWGVVGLIAFIVKKRNKSFAETANAGEGMPKAEFTSGVWFLWFVLVPVVLMAFLTFVNSITYFIAGLYGYMGTTGLFRKSMMEKNAARLILEKNYQQVYNYYQEKQGLFSFLRFIFPIPFAFMYGGYKKKMQFFRDHPRDCKSCGKPLSKLDENADNEYLSKGQVREEEIKSVDYDILLCADCKEHETLIYPYPNSKYSTCTKCNFKTFYVASRRTVRSATEYSEGLGEERKVCKYCGHQQTSTYSIPKIQKSSSSSGSSSSGGSWGGGRSSGGGASSSW